MIEERGLSTDKFKKGLTTITPVILIRFKGNGTP